jgi:hypothetical protein
MKRLRVRLVAALRSFASFVVTPVVAPALTRIPVHGVVR